MKTLTTAAQAAKLIRQELKAKFPHVSFSVRSRNFAGGDAVDISYTNGIPTKEIDAVVSKYQEGHFDGMTDMYEYDNMRKDIPQAKYVHVQREITPEVRAAVKAEIAADYGFKDANDEKEWREKCGMWSDQRIWREVQGRTF